MIKRCVYCDKQFKTDKKHPYTKTCCLFCCSAEYRKQNKEKIKEEKKRDWVELKGNKRKYMGFLKRNKVAVERFRKNNREKINEKQRKRYDKEYYQEYYQNNKERINKRNSNWRRKNKERFYNIRKKYLSTIKGKKAQRKNYARRKGTLSKIKSKQLTQIYIRDKNRCVYCGSKNHISIDHIVPLSKGGKDEIRNLCLACISCNSSKNNKNVFSWCKQNQKQIPEFFILSKSI